MSDLRTEFTTDVTLEDYYFYHDVLGLVVEINNGQITDVGFEGVN